MNISGSIEARVILEKQYFRGAVKTNQCSPDSDHFRSAFFLINIFVLFLHVWRFLYNG